MDREAIERAVAKAEDVVHEYAVKNWANDSWLIMDGRTFWKEINTLLSQEGYRIAQLEAELADADKALVAWEKWARMLPQFVKLLMAAKTLDEVTETIQWYQRQLQAIGGPDGTE